jgi:hypothetical protein
MIEQTASAAPSRDSWVATAIAYAYGLAVAAAMGWFLLGIPIQLTDSLGNMFKLDAPWGELLKSEFEQRSYLRPFLFAELKLVYDLSGGSYYAWFRGTHVAQVLALVLLYLHILRPRTWRDAAFVPLGLAILFGLHTFTGTVTEAFPVNTFLTVVLCCFAAVAISFGRQHWWTDLLAVALFVVASLTVESGLLVGVIFVGAAFLGARGVSRRAVAAVAVLFVGYFALRFVWLEVGAPGLVERSSGFGFRTLEPEELSARFGGNPWGFYAYNVATSFVSVLLSEPRGGVFRLTYGLTLNDPEPSQILNVIASLAASLLLCCFVWQRRRAWAARAFARDDQLVALFVLVLMANAAISYPYTKDVIMSPAGAMFAVAAVIAAREVLPDWSRRGRRCAAAASICCAVLGGTWAVRYVGVHLNLHTMAHRVRTEWAYVDDWVAREGYRVERVNERAILEYLRTDALYGHRAPPRIPLIDFAIFDVVR